MLDIEEKKLKFDKFKFIFQIITIFVSAIATIFGAYIAYQTYSDNKQHQYNQLYLSTLANLESSNQNIQKSALYELCRFKDKYPEIIPLLVDFLENNKKDGDSNLERSLITIFLIIGKPMIKELVQENRNSFERNDNRFSVTQWALSELVKRDVGKKLMGINLKNIFLQGIELNNLIIREVSLNGATINRVNFNGTSFIGVNLSNTNFTACSFWQTKFNADTNLNNATFHKSMFRDVTFAIDIDLTKTQFKDNGNTCESQKPNSCPF